MEQFISRTEKIKEGSIIIEEGSWAYYACFKIRQG